MKPPRFLNAHGLEQDFFNGHGFAFDRNITSETGLGELINYSRFYRFYASDELPQVFLHIWKIINAGALLWGFVFVWLTKETVITPKQIPPIQRASYSFENKGLSAAVKRVLLIPYD